MSPRRKSRTIRDHDAAEASILAERPDWDMDALSRRLRKLDSDAYTLGRIPTAPSLHLDGTPERLEELRERVTHKQIVRHPADPGDKLNTAIAADKVMNGREVNHIEIKLYVPPDDDFEDEPPPDFAAFDRIARASIASAIARLAARKDSTHAADTVKAGPDQETA